MSYEVGENPSCVVGENVVVGDQASVRKRCAIGEEAYIGAGAVVIADVPRARSRSGTPLGATREVDERELLENQ